MLRAHCRFLSTCFWGSLPAEGHLLEGTEAHHLLLLPESSLPVGRTEVQDPAPEPGLARLLGAGRHSQASLVLALPFSRRLPASWVAWHWWAGESDHELKVRPGTRGAHLPRSPAPCPKIWVWKPTLDLQTLT